MTEPQTAAGKALVIRRAMQNGVDLTDTAAMAVIAADILRIEAESRNDTLDEVVRVVEGLAGSYPREDNGHPMGLGGLGEEHMRAAVLDAVKALRS